MSWWKTLVEPIIGLFIVMTPWLLVNAAYAAWKLHQHSKYDR